MNNIDALNCITSQKLAPLGGQLNVNAFRDTLVGHTIRRVLRRFPIENRHILKSIAHEYAAIGFTSAGGTFDRRNEGEQLRFALRCVESGLLVLSPLRSDNSHFETPFLEEAVTMDKYLPQATDRQAIDFMNVNFADLTRAHKMGAVYGDRWSENTLVMPNGKIYNIDFDISISGPPAKEFEVAQVTYYTLAALKLRAQELAIPHLAKLLAMRSDLNMKYIDTFLRGHAMHFNANNKYGGLTTEVDTLVKRMYEEYESRQRSK